MIRLPFAGALNEDHSRAVGEVVISTQMGPMTDREAAWACAMVAKLPDSNNDAARTNARTFIGFFSLEFRVRRRSRRCLPFTRIVRMGRGAFQYRGDSQM